MSDPNQPQSQRYTLAADENPSAGVWSVIAAMENCSLLDLPPLAEATDPDALDNLLATESGMDEVSFEYYGYKVTATSDEIYVQIHNS